MYMSLSLSMCISLSLYIYIYICMYVCMYVCMCCAIACQLLVVACYVWYKCVRTCPNPADCMHTFLLSRRFRALN